MASSDLALRQRRDATVAEHGREGAQRLRQRQVAHRRSADQPGDERDRDDRARARHHFGDQERREVPDESPLRERAQLSDRWAVAEAGSVGLGIGRHRPHAALRSGRIGSIAPVS